MAARNQQLINNTEAFMAKFCQYKHLLPFRANSYRTIRDTSKSEEVHGTGVCFSLNVVLVSGADLGELYLKSIRIIQVI